MNTVQMLANAKRFREATGALSRSEQLKWFSEALGVEPITVLRLLGYRTPELKRHGPLRRKLVALADAKPDQTVWVTELFRELADRAGYDVARMSDLLRRPAAEPPAGATVGRGRTRPSVSRLLRIINTGGPHVLDDLAEYIRAEPEERGRRTSRES